MIFVAAKISPQIIISNTSGTTSLLMQAVQWSGDVRNNTQPAVSPTEMLVEQEIRSDCTRLRADAAAMRTAIETVKRIPDFAPTQRLFPVSPHAASDARMLHII